MNQLNHYNTQFQKRTFPIVVVTDNVTSPANMGSLFRISDAFGVQQLILCGPEVFISRKVLRTSRATEKVVDFRIVNDAHTQIEQLKSEGFFIVALEITKTSTPLTNFEFPKHLKIALIVGGENFGVSENLLQLCDHIVHINMFGHNSSMNVAQATSIALYEITKQLV